ncbi:TIGR04540 family protein [Bacillus wiedmannii]|uniref:TIGR04540 family protein n=1 Tax=Bacillus wiedmannii TaxID=1890302 RepID=UPI001F0B3190|nr:TIGR04540 family protein [Bacillus wiedmannii]
MVILELKLFYRTQRDLATALNHLVDAYWQEKIDELEFVKGVKNLHEHNTNKMIKDNHFTKVIQQTCGKRRLEIIDKIIEKNKSYSNNSFRD